MKKRKRFRNVYLAIVQKEDPERLKERTVKPERGRGRKDRPRKSEWRDESFDNAVQVF